MLLIAFRLSYSSFLVVIFCSALILSHLCIYYRLLLYSCHKLS